MPLPPVVWDNPDIVDMLRWLIDQCQSASATAEMLSVSFGVVITRNMAIGKARRLGMFFASTAQPKRGPQSPRPPRKSIGAGKIVAMRKARAMPVWRSDPQPAPEGGTVSLIDRRPNQCAYPFGEPGQPDFLVCGALSITGRPYCAGHMAIAYKPVQERKREAA